MTDLETWQAHFDLFHVKYVLATNLPDDFVESDSAVANVWLKTDEGNGYGDFYFAAHFDGQGKFIEYGVWE